LSIAAGAAIPYAVLNGEGSPWSIHLAFVRAKGERVAGWLGHRSRASRAMDFFLTRPSLHGLHGQPVCRFLEALSDTCGRWHIGHNA
jgi:hypothetical protein